MRTTDHSVDVCVCTFRRRSIEATLASLAAQSVGREAFRVIVADNDDDDRARGFIEGVAAREGLRLTYRHAPARNISLARNAALDAASAPFVAVLDDDEVAEPTWLEALLRTAQESGADVVLGPVRARYAPEQPRWMREGDFHSTLPVVRDGTIATGYTCNVLFRRTGAALDGARFRLDLGRSGGEDTEFFHRAFRAGARIVFAPDAVVSEPVEPGRARLSWLMRRRFRSGQSHGLILRAAAPGPARRAVEVVRASAKLAVCGAGAVLFAPSPRRGASYLLRAALHAGVVSRLAGVRELTIYGGGDLVTDR